MTCLNNIPLSALGFSFLAAVVTWDLNFDYAGNKEITHSYYKTVHSAPMPFPLVIPMIIVITFIPLVINLLKSESKLPLNCIEVLRLKFYDILTVILNIPTLYIFIVILTPNQEEQVKYKFDDPKIANNFEINRYWHLVILPLMILSMIIQVLARCSGSESSDEDNEDGKEKRN